jgi:hypothetical protein
MPLHVKSTWAHHQEVKIVLYSLWYHHTETSEWSKITKVQFYKYEHTVVKFVCEFFGCDCCVLLTIKMLWHVEVMFNQLLNLLERYYVHIYVCWVNLVIKSYKLLISCIYKVMFVRLLKLLKLLCLFTLPI